MTTPSPAEQLQDFFLRVGKALGSGAAAWEAKLREHYKLGDEPTQEQVDAFLRDAHRATILVD